jgi:hypothetical protein
MVLEEQEAPMSDENGFEGAGLSELEPSTRAARGEESKPMSKRHTTKQPWDVQVDVHLKKACPNPQFEIYTSLPVQNGNIMFENNHRPGFNIEFNLYDETGNNYVFPPQSKVKEACWSKVGTACPTSEVWEVFDPKRVTNAGSTLEVYNDNPSPSLGAFKYTLRVTKDGGTTYCELDPGGGDMNGSRS